MGLGYLLSSYWQANICNRPTAFVHRVRFSSYIDGDFPSHLHTSAHRPFPEVSSYRTVLYTTMVTVSITEARVSVQVEDTGTPLNPPETHVFNLDTATKLDGLGVTLKKLLGILAYQDGDYRCH